MNMRSSLLCLCVMFCVSGYVETENSSTIEESSRGKRQVNSIPLVYPYGGTYKLLIGMTSPVPTIDGISLYFSSNFQYQYLQIQNISELSQYYFIKTVSREQREAEFKERRDDRLVFYDTFANLLDMKGMNGLECILRAICEAAQYPVEEEGLIGEILHILLTPDYGGSAFDEEDPEWEQSMSQFRDAATAGRQMFNCPSIYSGCPEGQGLLELATTLRDQ